MKILIAYHSDTGNTAKIAKSMKEGLEEEKQTVTLLSAKDVDPLSLKTYDLVILGSGIYAGNIGKNVNNLMKKVTEFPPRFAFFTTHTSPTAYQKAFSKISESAKQNNSKILGEFDCEAENIGIPEDKQMMMLSRLPLDQQSKAKEHMKSIKGRPNQEDLKKAKQFAKSLIK